MSTRDHEIPTGALERFAVGKARPRERHLITRHLLRGCAICQERLRAGRFPTGIQLPPGAYDAAFAAAAEEVARALPRGQSPTALLRELDGVPPERRELRVRNQPRFASLPLAEALVERSHALRYHDPEGMLREAHLAVAVAEAIRPALTPVLVHDARALTWGQLANAQRLCDELPEARMSFRKAFQYQEWGSGDGALRARLCRSLATLCYKTRDFGRAAELLTEAVVISRRLRQPREEAMALMQLGILAIIFRQSRSRARAAPPKFSACSIGRRMKLFSGWPSRTSSAAGSTSAAPTAPTPSVPTPSR